MFYCDGVSDTEIDYYSGGSSTVIAGPVSVTYTPGDVFKFEVVGTTLTAYKNGSSILSTTDSTYSTAILALTFIR